MYSVHCSRLYLTFKLLALSVEHSALSVPIIRIMRSFFVCKWLRHTYSSMHNVNIGACCVKLSNLIYEGNFYSFNHKLKRDNKMIG